MREVEYVLHNVGPILGICGLVMGVLILIGGFMGKFD